MILKGKMLMHFVSHLYKTNSIVVRSYSAIKVNGNLLKTHEKCKFFLIKRCLGLNHCNDNTALESFIYKMKYINEDLYMHIGQDKWENKDNSINENIVDGNDKLIHMIRCQANIEDLMKLLEVHGDKLEIHHCGAAVYKLFNLKKSIWASGDSSFMESVNLNGNITEMKSFPVILSKLEDNVATFSIDEATNLMFCLNHFGVQLSYPTMKNLYYRILPSIELMGIHCLALLTQMLHYHVGTGANMRSIIIQRTYSLMNTCRSEDDIKSLAFIVSASYTNSEEWYDRYLKRLSKFLQKKKFIKCDSLIPLLKSSLLLDNKFSIDLKSNFNINKKISEHLLTQIPTFPAEKLIHLNYIIPVYHSFYQLSTVIEKRARVLKNGCSSERMKFHLTKCLNNDFNRNFNVHERLHYYICERHWPTYHINPNNDSFPALWMMIKLNLDNTSENSVFVMTQNMIRDVLDNRSPYSNLIMQYVINYVKSNNELLKHYMHDFVIITNFFLKFVGAIRDPILENCINHILENGVNHILENAHQLNASDINSLSKSIYFLNNTSPNHFSVIKELETALNEQSKLLCKQHLYSNECAELLSSYYSREQKFGGNRDDALIFDELASRMSRNLTTKSIWIFVSSSTSCYCQNNQLFDAVADFIVENEEYLSKPLISKVLQWFCKNERIPNNPAFTSTCYDILKRHIDRATPGDILNYWAYFHILQKTTVDLDKITMKLDFLEKLENRKQMNNIVLWKSICIAKRVYDTEHLFLMPSLADVNSYPDLSTLRYSRMLTALQILCRKDNVKILSNSIYGHNIHAEFIVDENGLVLPYQSVEEEIDDRPNDNKRVAVFFSKRTSRLSDIGTKRDLQFLGYHVILISCINFIPFHKMQQFCKNCITNTIPNFK